MNKTVYLKDLAPVTILFPGDFRALASLMLRGFDALNKGTNTTSRPTIHGVGNAFARIFIALDHQTIDGKLRKMGFDLGACVEEDPVAAEPGRV